jgi:CrcB protein
VLSLGGALGVNARFWLGVWMNRWTSPAFPWATFTINVSGSFAIGLLAEGLTHWLPHPNVRLLVVVGFLGGYTTFSTFSFDTLTLWERGEAGLSLANGAGSVLAGLLAVGLGVALARGLTVPAPQRARAANPAASIRARIEPHGQAPAKGDAP